MKRTLILFLMLSLQVQAIVPQSVSVVCSNDPALSGIYSHSVGSIWQSSTNTLWKEFEEETTPWYISGGGKTYTAPDNGLDVPPLVFSKVGVPPSITVSGTGTEADDEYVLMDQYGEKPDWYSYNADAAIAWWYDGWWYISAYREGGDTWTNSGTGELPDKTGWSIGSIYGSPAPTLAYDSAISTVSYTFAEYANAMRTDLGLAVPQAMLPWSTYTNLLASTNSVWLIGVGDETNVFNFIGSNPHAEIVKSPCLTFGGADYVTFGNLSTSPTSLLFDGWFNTAGGTYFSSADSGLQLRNNGGAVELFDRARFALMLKTSGIDVTNRWIFLRLTRNTTTGYAAIYIDDMTTPVVSTTTDSNSFVFTEFEIGRWHNTLYPEYMNGSCAGVRLVLDGVEKINCPFAESSGTILYDVSGSGNNGTLTTTSEALSWANTQPVYAYFPNYGGVTWSSGTTNVYVPNTLAGVPATNAVAGFTIARTNLTGMVHNRGSHKIKIGTNEYIWAELINNATYLSTNATGQIGAYAK